MLNQLIGSKIRQILLSAFFGSPEKEFYTRQLSSTHKISVGTTHRELERLVLAGILTERRVGNIRLFALNRQNPVYSELKALILKTEGAVGLVRSALSKVKGVKFSFIYGSFAKQEERPDSDIDIFLVGDAINDKELVLCVSRLEKKLFKEINYTCYKSLEYKKEKDKHNSFILEVIKGKKIFIKGSDSDL